MGGRSSNSGLGNQVRRREESGGQSTSTSTSGGVSLSVSEVRNDPVGTVYTSNNGVRYIKQSNGRITAYSEDGRTLSGYRSEKDFVDRQEKLRRRFTKSKSNRRNAFGDYI